jgi:endonuclease III related protein
MNVFEKLYKELKNKYGFPKGQWKLWCKRPKTRREREKVIIGAVLTQRTSWNNVELVLDNLKKAKADSLKAIHRLGKRKLSPLIRSSGFYRAKADCLLGLAGFVLKDCGGLGKMKETDRRELRERLLGLKGIGPETADSILLYALDKPCFVVDEYTRRLVKKRGLAEDISYASLQEMFGKSLKKDFRLYQDFHALIVIDGKNQTG